VITPSGAANLLDLMEEALKSLLANSGNTIILDCEVDRSGVTKFPDIITTISSDAPGDTVDDTFTWTSQALLIRAEISSLADISEDLVHERSSIFELGLDSIDVIKLASRLKKHEIGISVSAIIKSQTIAKMLPQVIINSVQEAQALYDSTVRTMSRDLEAYLKSQGSLPPNIEAVLPATPLQQTMVNEMIKSDYQRYFNLEAFELNEGIDLQRMKSAVEQVLADSPILRVSFVKVDDPSSSVSYAQILQQHHPGISDSEEKTLGEFMDGFKTKSAQIAASRSQLCQVHFALTAKKRYMVIAISHALYDGTSLRILHTDIDKAYHSNFRSRPNFIPFLEDVFKSATEDAKSYWRGSLSNLPLVQFPRKKTSDVSKPITVHRIERTSRAMLKDVEELCKSLKITLQTLGQTCWTLVLSHLMGQLDIVFGSVLSCRDSEEVNEIMFPLMNTVAVRAVLHGNLSEMLKYMQEMSDATRQYQHFPLGTAQAYALASRMSGPSVKDTTLFDTLFIYQGRRISSSETDLYKSVSGTAEVEFPICVEMEVLDEHIFWTTACKSSVRSLAETDELVTMLDDVLERILAAPSDQTIVSSNNGISVCGLPTFQKTELLPKTARETALELDDGEWSASELSIRRALHSISDIPEDMIHKDTTIFHLGLDSILILKLPALLKVHGIKLSISDILRDQNIFSMAKSAAKATTMPQDFMNIDTVISNAISSLNIPTTKSELGEVQYMMPVTAGQLYMIRMWQISRGVLFYPSFTFTLRGKLDKQRLELAWARLLQLHDILRTGFVEIGVDILQVVFRDPPNAVIYDTESLLPGLEAPPIILWVEENPNSATKLKLIIHHALYDGISVPIIIKQLEALYQGQTLDSPKLKFKSFVAQSIASSTRPFQSSIAVAREKWKSYLTSDSLCPTSSVITHQRTEVFHPSRTIIPLKQLAQDSGVTTDSLLLAAISKLHAQRFPNMASTVVFGIYLANRAPFGSDLSSLVAPTLNLLPLCVRDPISRDLPSIAKDIQRDLQLVSSADMVSASLAEIYKWTGVRVNFFVNIIKDYSSGKDKENSELLVPSKDLGKRVAVVEDVINETIAVPANGCEAYMVSKS
jgi:aryl carrier-like protein